MTMNPISIDYDTEIENWILSACKGISVKKFSVECTVSPFDDALLSKKVAEFPGKIAVWIQIITPEDQEQMTVMEKQPELIWSFAYDDGATLVKIKRTQKEEGGIFVAASGHDKSAIRYFIRSLIHQIGLNSTISVGYKDSAGGSHTALVRLEIRNTSKVANAGDKQWKGEMLIAYKLSQFSEEVYQKIELTETITIEPHG